MGSKSSNNLTSNRPESGGANRDDIQEKSGLLEREKSEFAASEKAKREQAGEAQGAKSDHQSGDEGELQD